MRAVEAVKEFLEKECSVCTIRTRLHVPEGVPEAQLVSWETKTQLSLPKSLRSLYSNCNGVSLSWSMPDIPSFAAPSGFLAINPIEQLNETSFTMEIDVCFGTLQAKLDAQPLPHDPPVLQQHTGDAATYRAFTLEKAKCGTVLLVHCTDGNEDAAADTEDASWEVWLCALDGSNHRIAASFDEYARQMVTHVGIPNWQLALCSAIGLDAQSLDWWWLFRPDQLALDPATGALLRQ